MAGNDVADMLELTKQEKQVIIFLMVTGLLGIGILCYKSLIYKPKIKIVSAQEIEKEVAASKVININTAAKDDLIRLRGIGPALAEAIIEYRAAHGNFMDKEDLRKVKGIGPAKFEKIKEYIKTE